MKLLRDPPCDPVNYDEIDVPLFVRLLRSAAWPELDDDVLAKAVFCHGERLVEHNRYIVLPVTKRHQSNTTMTTTTTSTHNIQVGPLYSSEPTTSRSFRFIFLSRTIL